MGVFDELKSRGLIAQVTNEKKVKDILNNQKINRGSKPSIQTKP